MFEGVPERRVGALAGDARTRSSCRALDRGEITWCVIPGPNAGWAEAVFGEPDLERLWDAVADRLPARRRRPRRRVAPAPRRAWPRARPRSRSGASTRCAIRGPGTDLEIGLLPAAHWATAALPLAGGVPCVVNLPTEEVYTTPDARRTEGHVRTTMPFNLGGATVRGLELTFRGGRCVEVRAERGRGARARRDGGRRRRAAASARSRWSTATRRSRRPACCSWRRCSTRTPSCHIAWGFGAPEIVDGAAGRSTTRRASRRHQPLRRAHRRDDRLARARGGRGGRAGRAPCRSCATAPGSSADGGRVRSPDADARGAARRTSRPGASTPS